MSREADIQKKLEIMTGVLREIARSEDCRYIDEREKPDPCDCPVCMAKEALGECNNWRFIGARHYRIKYNPRERKMAESWKKQLGWVGRDADQALAMILSNSKEERHHFPPDEMPTARDWYVASSIVQWLATNVGMAVLEDAGFKYMQFDEDRKENDRREKREREKREKREGK